MMNHDYRRWHGVSRPGPFYIIRHHHEVPVPSTILQADPMQICRKDVPGILFTLLLPALYVALIGRFGWSDTDDGFILGYAWRVLNGEVPYRDFVSVRPPLSMYLHALWFWLLPERLVYVGARYVYVLQLMLSAVLAMRLVRDQLGKDDRGAGAMPWGLLTLLGFALSAGALTPMPWHTVDGIFFAMLALFLVAKPSRMGLVLGALALFLACMAKQSFYPLIALFVIILLLQKRPTDSLLLVLVVAALGGVFWACLQAQGVWGAFVRQTMGSTTWQDAVNAGVLSYVRLPWRPLLWGCALALVARWVAKRRGWAHAGANDMGVIALVFLLEGAYRYHKRGDWFEAQSLGLAQVLFGLAAMGVVLLFKRGAHERQAAIWLAGLLGIAWCSSISWGFQTPILFATPLVLGAFLLLSRHDGLLGTAPMGKVAHLGLMAWVALALLPVWHPYRDQIRPKLVCDMGRVSERLSYVVSTQNNCDKLAEALRFATSFQSRPLAFLPAFTLQGYLAGNHNPLPSNWPMLAEMGNDPAAYQRKLDELVHHVVLDQREGDEFSQGSSNGKFFVASVEHVRRHWRLLQRGKFYEVYANPLK